MTTTRAVPEATGALLPGVARIAVLRANALGDFLFATPALAALRAAYPAAEVTLLGAPWHTRFLRDRPGPVDRVVVVPPAPGIRAADPGEAWSAADVERFRAAGRAERFDLGLQLHGGGAHSTPLLASLRPRLTAGLRAPDAPALDRWIRYTLHQPEVSRYLEAVALVGAAPVTLRPSVTVGDADRLEALTVAGAPGRPRVALHPGAADPRRQWPPERFAAVGDAAAARGAEVFVTGSAAERGIVGAVTAGMRAPARPLVDRLSVGGLAALYVGCAVVVANDTGPLHLAAAVGAATVGLFWVGNAVNSGPFEQHRHRALLSWTMSCPRCGAGRTAELYPLRDNGPGCDHGAAAAGRRGVDLARDAPREDRIAAGGAPALHLLRRRGVLEQEAGGAERDGWT
ncbi:glycosyltransferase family 9 protein [Dactylosporangium sp. NPDC051541]|uniref:glycosyltransferase family 9 protein n=1 Tax=Dactylosporangium sp. NPDC051541 TaxID=3363977 RepID=UPI0037937E50